MNHNEIIQIALDYIDENVEEPLSAAAIAHRAGYSVYHFSRLFADLTGMSVMSYVTWRRLQFAQYNLSQGSKVIDTAMEFGFHTHAGFTKAFRRCFGYPPSLCFLRINAVPPCRETPSSLKQKLSGGKKMNPHIIELSPFSVIGYPKRHKMPNVKKTANIPAFWDTINMDCSDLLTMLHHTFTHSKHFEISMCYDVNEADGEFTYLLGRGIDNPEDFAGIQPDMERIDISGGLYAIFSTTPVDDYIQTIQDTWNEILQIWLPTSEFEYDEARPDFEYYDYRDHRWYFEGKQQMDICIPIKQREEEAVKSKLRLACEQ